MSMKNPLVPKRMCFQILKVVCKNLNAEMVEFPVFFDNDFNDTVMNFCVSCKIRIYRNKGHWIVVVFCKTRSALMVTTRASFKRPFGRKCYPTPNLIFICIASQPPNARTALSCIPSCTTSILLTLGNVNRFSAVIYYHREILA